MSIHTSQPFIELVDEIITHKQNGEGYNGNERKIGESVYNQ